MANPFENDDAEYLVLVNDEGQHSLWPARIEVPAGWAERFGPAARPACLAHVEEQWTDMRPLSLVRAMDATS
ncbi:MbtH family protein [Kitasatospora viridis]|uniref:MbtH protein n=1 Tax=Kitasatospora viridis TaxID=281105 RepID=A0A561SDH4_9ACTN|nr:MbtH family protein [Kitasatospora viridis]TWF72919.1 MbtH protein [Kitasatospora viridis]